MQSNENTIAPLRGGYSLPDILRHLRVIFDWLRNDEEAQHLYESIHHHHQARLTGAAGPLSSPSTISVSSSNTFASMPNPSLLDDLTWRIRAHPSNIAIPTYSDFPSSQPSPGPARYIGHWNTTLFIDEGRRMRAPSSRASSSVGVIPAPSSVFGCPFCAELGRIVVIQRIQDLKRHFKRNHKNHDPYICPHDDCNLAFDCEETSKRHSKQAHRRAASGSPAAQVKLRPRVVFACGFSICKYVLEAENGDDAEEKVNIYFDHVVNHLSKKNPKLQWEYAVRFKNLMHQTGLKTAWKNRNRANQSSGWQPRPHNSFVLMKIIETGRYCDAARLVRCVEAIGSPPYNESGSPAFELPHNLSLSLEVNVTGGLAPDMAELPTKDPDHISTDAAVTPTTPRTVHDEYPVQFPPRMDSYAPASQCTQGMLHQSYHLNMSETDHVVPYVHPSYQSQVPYGACPASVSFSDGLPVTYPFSAYPSGPLDWNSASYVRPEDQDHLVDPRILAPSNYPVTLTSMDLETDQDATDLDQDYS